MRKGIGLLKLATPGPIIVLLAADGQSLYACMHGHFRLEELILNRNVEEKRFISYNSTFSLSFYNGCRTLRDTGIEPE